MDRTFETGQVSTTPPPVPSAPVTGFPIGLGPDETTTKVGAYWFYQITEEIRNVIVDLGGLVPDHLKVNQMAQAIHLAIAAMGNSKADKVHRHAISDIDGLPEALDGIGTHTHSFLKNGNGTAVLSPTGDLVASGNVSAYSDARIKTDIQVIEDALMKVQLIRGVTYKRKDIPELPRQIGVIAQEVQEVQPELVIEGPEGMLAVAYANMAGLLIEAIKELNAKVEGLETLVKKLGG